ncbi:MAG: VWA domain-containing protein [Chloroflexi bacterium]|nr:VWA domain-containing protein [Chloroflexota bacterium]
MREYRYSFWDGTQEPFDLHPDEVMDELADDLFNDSSVMRALQRLMQRGMTNQAGQRTRGIRDLLEQLKQRRRQEMERYDLGSVLNDIKERLQDIVDTEREGIDRRLQEARQRVAQDPSQASLLQTVQNLADRRRDTLDQLPDDPAGQIKQLSDYDFMDAEARQKFQELMDELKQKMMEQYFKDMQSSLQGMTPEQMQGMKQMLKDLNQMLDQHSRGQLSDQQFQQFMQRYGEMFGPNQPANMEELMEQIQERMAQAQSLLDSMPEETRQQLQDLMASLMDDEMRQELGMLSAMMDDMYPPDDLSRQYPFSGQEEISLDEAMRVMDQLQQMENLEAQLKDIRTPDDLERVDEEKLAELLGDEAKRTWEELKKLMKRLEEAGYIRRKGDRLELTPRGIRKIGQKAVRDIFAQLKKDRIGSHETRYRGMGGENTGETKPWEFGDDFAVDLQKSLMNTVRREGVGTPLRMRVDDFEVERVEHRTEAATCLLLDRSRSMGYYGNFTAAKKVAIALHSLISSQYPRDALYIIGFSDVAVEFKGEDLPELSWDTGISGTNMHHAFMMSRKLLAKHKGCTRQIIMVTDGEPTAHLDHGVPYFSYPPSPQTIRETLKEGRRCAQEGIVINTFMLENSYPLIDFINLLSRVNRGRAFYASPDKLGEYVLVDFLNNRRTRVA